MTIIIKTLVEYEPFPPHKSTVFYAYELRENTKENTNLHITDLSIKKRDLSKQTNPQSTNPNLNLDHIWGGAAVSIAPTQLANGFPDNQSVREPPPPTSPSGNWSASLQTILDRPPATLPQHMLIGGIAFAVAFGSWANFGSLDEVGKAAGILVPQGEAYKINPVISGKIARVYVREGQAVKAGQIIAEIDDKLAFTEIQRLQQQQNSLSTELIHTNALIDRTKLEAQTQSAIARSEQQAHTQTIDAAKARLAASRQVLDQLRNQQTSNLDRQTQLKPLLTKSRQLIDQRRKEIAVYQERVDTLRPLLEAGAISKEMYINAEQAVRDREYAIAKSQLDETPVFGERLFEAEQTSAQISRTITQNQGEIAQSEREIESMQAVLAQKQEQAIATQNQAQQKLQQLQIQRTQLVGKIRDLIKQQEQAKTQIQQLKLTAPVDGTVLSLNVRNSGEVVQSGQTIAQIAPHTAPLVLQALLPNREAGFIKPGHPAQLKFDAFPYQDYGIIPGKVLTISPDAKPDERLGAVYRVEIQIDPQHLVNNNQPIKFKPGQTANAEIITRHRRIIDVILDPIRQIQNSGINL